MNGLHGIIFAYEKAPGLRELTEARMPGSVPFGGRYRVVDFMLSNMAGAGITDVGVVLHGNYQSLLDHIGSSLRPPFLRAMSHVLPLPMWSSRL